MVNIAISVNILWIIFMAYVCFKYGVPSSGDLLGLLLVLLTLVVNLFALFSCKELPKRDNLFSLFIERKMLEEKKRIEELKGVNK
jgi:hypothetical protein